jgi:hypothetical protein
MNKKKILSLTMATVMAVSGGPILVGCSNDKSTNYKDFKKVVSKQDKEDEEEAKNNNVFRGGYVGNSFFYYAGMGRSNFDSSTSSGWKSWSMKPSSSSSTKVSSDGSYSTPKATSFTG